ARTGHRTVAQDGRGGSETNRLASECGRMEGSTAVQPFPRRHDIGHRHREGGDRQGLNPTAQRRPLRGLRYPCTKTPDWVYGFSGIRTTYPSALSPPSRRAPPTL